MVAVVRFLVKAALLVSVFCPLTAAANENENKDRLINPSEILAYQGEVVLTQSEIDAAFSKIPEEERQRFVRDGGRVDQLIRILLTRKAIAADAMDSGFDKVPPIADRMRLEAEKELAEAWMEKVMADMPPGNYEKMAYEHYQTNPDAYRSPEVLDISHILISTKDRSVIEAKRFIYDLRDQLLQDASKFDTFVDDFSDDSAKVENRGRYTNMKRGAMVASFEEAAFALAVPGEISEPVQTDYGFHLIRLNSRSGGEPRDYEDVKDEAVARAKSRHLQHYRETYLKKIASDPVVVPAESVEIMAKRYFGENYELAPDYQP